MGTTCGKNEVTVMLDGEADGAAKERNPIFSEFLPHVSGTYNGPKERSSISQGQVLLDAVIALPTRSSLHQFPELSARFTQVVCGDLGTRFAAKPKVVRIFTSSTFTDTEVERNALIINVIPKLKMFCQEKGYEFQVVDMRWGVREQSADDHTTLDLCLKELKACQQISTGPNFVTFLGQKYGFRPFPPRIPGEEFNQLTDVLDREEDGRLLSEWFKCDHNSVPPTYVLQPISSRLPDYLSPDRIRRRAAWQEWQGIFSRLQQVLRRAASKALKDKQQVHKYFMSVTESEIRQGILLSTNPSNECCWLSRNITDLTDHETTHAHHMVDGRAHLFIDIGENRKVDTEAQRLLVDLKHQILYRHLPEANIKNYDVRWQGGGVDLCATAEHKVYIDQMCRDVQSVLEDLISQAIERRLLSEVRDPMFEEALQHLAFCQSKCEKFYGREDVLMRCREILTVNQESYKQGRVVSPTTENQSGNVIKENGKVPNGDENFLEKSKTSSFSSQKNHSLKCKVHPAERYAERSKITGQGSGSTQDDMRICNITSACLNKPLVIHGESGCGKTSVVSMVAMKARDWLGGDISIIVRYIGTTPDSSLVRLLLRSVCNQICAIYHEDSSFIRNDIKELREDFVRCLRMASAEQPLLIVLDSLDQLGAEDGARQLSWLPMTLPDHVNLVVSTIPGEQYECFPVLKAFLPSECFVLVPILPQEDAANILVSYLRMENRTLSADQQRIVQRALQECSLPIFVRVAFDEAIRWKSYSPPCETVLEHTVRGAIDALFERVERQHGRVLVSRALGYVTAAKSGLTETELEDVLSLDDHVLDDVYQYWTPPVRRIPPLLWVRIREDLAGYLVTRGADGARVVTWYHRQFIEAAQARYLNVEEQTLKLHSNLSDYFLGRWSKGAKKPYTTPDGNSSSADRLVAPQPLVYESTTGNPTYNYRKLNELPYHLVCAKQLDVIKEEVLCNFEVLVTNLEASSLRDVLDDYDFALHCWPEDDDITLVKETLQLSAYALSQYSAQLPSQLLGRIHKTESRFLKSLMQQATHCSRASLVPSTCCLTSPGGPMVHALTGQTMPSTTLSVSDDGSLVASASADSSVTLWEVSTGRLVRSMKDAGDNISSVLVAQGNTLIVTSCPGCVSAWRVSTGQRIFRIVGHDSCVPISTVTMTTIYDSTLLVTLASPHIKLINLETGVIMREFADDKLQESDKLVSQVSMGITGSLLLYTGASLEGDDGMWVRSCDLETGEFSNAMLLSTNSGSMEDLIGVTAYGTLLFCSGRRTTRRNNMGMASNYVLELWSLETQSRMRRLCNHDDRVRCFALSNDNTKMITLGGSQFLDTANVFQGIVKIVDLSSGESQDSVLRYPSNINHIAYIDDSHFISSSNDKLLRVWDLQRNNTHATQDFDEEKEVFSSRGSLVTFFGSDSAGVMNVYTGSVVRFTDGKAPQMQIVDDSRVIVTNNGEMFLYDLAKRRMALKFDGKTRADWLKSFFVFNQSDLVALATDGKSMYIYDVTSGKRTAQLLADKDLQIVEFSHSSDGRYCVTAHCTASQPEVSYGYVVWDVQRRENLQTIRSEHQTRSEDLEISNNGRYLMEVVFNNSRCLYRAQLYDVTSGRVIHRPEPDVHVHEAAFTEDSGYFLLGLKDGRLQLYDVDSGMLLHSMRAHNGAIHRIYTSDLIDIVMTTAGGLDSKDRSVRLWKIHGQRFSLLTVFTPDAKVSSMSFAAEGRAVAMEITDIVPFWLINQDSHDVMHDLTKHGDDVIKGNFTVSLRKVTIDL